MRSSHRYHPARISEGASLWKTDAFGGLEMIRAQYVEFSFAPHTHDEYMIAVTESGEGYPHFRGKSHHVGPGEILVLNPGEVHGGGPARDAIWRYRAFYAPAKLMQLSRPEPGGAETPGFLEDVISDPALAERLRSAHTALETAESTLMNESLLLGMLAELVERHASGRQKHPDPGSHPAVNRAIEHLEALPGENVSLEALSQEAGLSPYYFCRVFRKQTGLSPHGYQLLVRVRHAKRLLSQGMPISQAAVQAGFFDQAHFTRHFKRIYGVPPGTFFPHELPH